MMLKCVAYTSSLCVLYIVSIELKKQVLPVGKSTYISIFFNRRRTDDRPWTSSTFAKVQTTSSTSWTASESSRHSNQEQLVVKSSTLELNCVSFLTL